MGSSGTSDALSVLLSRSIAALTPDASVVVWSNVLQYVGDGGAPVRDMPRRSCLSKRALRSAYSQLTRRGLAVVEPGEVRGGQTLLLTDAGRVARDSWAPVDPSDAAAGADVGSAREVLVPIVSSLACEQAHYPTQYGPVDCSIRGGPGQDWKPVPRGDHAEHRTPVEGLALLALLSQCFLELAIEYETTNPALAVAANVFAWVPDEGAAVSSLPRDATSLLDGLERHGGIERRAEGTAATVTLTPAGRHWRDRHAPTLAAIEAGWRERFGSTAIDRLGAWLSSFVASAPADRVEGVWHPPTYALFGYGYWR